MVGPVDEDRFVVDTDVAATEPAPTPRVQPLRRTEDRHPDGAM